MDPIELGKSLGQAQDVQTVLGVVIGMLLVALLAVVKFWLASRTEWGAEKLKLSTEHEREKGELTRVAAENAGQLAVAHQADAVEWEKARTGFVQRERDLIEVHAAKVEGLMREMLDLAVGVEKALDKLGRLAEQRDAATG